MANSGTVTAGSAALASQYNNLRADVLNVSTGHTHTGASENGAKVAATGVSSGTALINTVLTADGSGGASFAALAAAGADMQEFTTSGSWVKPAGKSAVYVFAIGGGGGGASGQRNTAAAYGSHGGGGGAHSARWIPAASLAGTVTVTIGAGGAGGTAPAAGSTVQNGVDGAFGGDTSFGTVAFASGGLPGLFSTANTAPGSRGIVEWGIRGLNTTEDASARTSDAAGTTVMFDTNTSDRLPAFLQPGRGSGATYGAVRAMNRTGGGAAGGYADATGYVGGAGARGFGWNGNIANGGTVGGGNATSADGIGGGGGGGGPVTNGTAGNGGNGYLGGGGGGGGNAYRTAGDVRAGAGGTGGGGYIIVVSV